MTSIIQRLFWASGGACLAMVAMLPVRASETDEATATLLSRAIEQAIPEVYEKQKDWGREKEIAVGVRTRGKGLKTRLVTRKKSVPHGLWKHYRVTRRPEGPPPKVRLANLHVNSEGRSEFSISIDAEFDYWGRAKLYQYGVHVIALEIVGSGKVTLQVDGDVGVKFGPTDDGYGLTVDPRVNTAKLDVHEWRVDRVSNLHGPLVRELGDEIRDLIEHELSGEKLAAKLNRAIDKKRERLAVTLTAWGESAK
ncbi:MAG: hypothetical protein KDA61_07545 [Planctomycetales bacterium]|nr:hypothetical protein [Planctomycetales bacterium]